MITVNNGSNISVADDEIEEKIIVLAEDKEGNVFNTWTMDGGKVLKMTAVVTHYIRL